MKIKKLLRCFVAIATGIFLINSCAFALPSLDAQNWDTLTVDEKIGNKTNETVITVIRDSTKPLVWYYVPNRPRLAETVYKEDSKVIRRPVFQLMTLQTKAAETRKIYEEGLLQFSLRMDLQPPTASQAKSLIFKKEQAETERNNKKIDDLKTKISTLEDETKELKKDEKKNKDKIKENEVDLKLQEKELEKLETITKVSSRDQIKLIPLPVASASVSIYEPSGKWLSGGIQAPAIAPIFSTQAVPFQVNLTSLGADAMKALTQKGQGGLGVYYELHFEGVLPPAKFTIEVDWDQTFKHFSENTKEKHYWNALLFAGGTKSTDKKTISEDLMENKCIKVKMEGREDELEALQQVLDPIMERINNELVAKMSPPEKVDPAEAKEPSYGIGMFYGGGSSYAMKDKKVVKKGKETISFERAKIITRATSCGTFIGIGNYDKQIIEEANIVMDPGNWEKAYYTIPSVGNDPQILSIDLNQYVVYKEGSDKPAGAKPRFPGTENPQLITWKPKAVNGEPGWIDRDGNSVSNISWPLQALYEEARKAGKDIKDYVEYKVEVTISSKGKRALVDQTKLEKLIPMMAGNKPVTNPMALVETLSVVCDYLSLDKSKGLKKVSFQIERKSADGKKRLDSYKWDFDYKDLDEETTIHSWFIPKEGNFQYIPKVRFMTFEKRDNGKKYVDWEYNNFDLLSDEGYGSLELDPDDSAWDF